MRNTGRKRAQRLARINDELAKLLSCEEEKRAFDAVNPDANCGANDPAESSDSEIIYSLEGSHDGVFWDTCERARAVSHLGRAMARCPYRHARLVRVTREVVEVLDGCGHA